MKVSRASRLLIAAITLSAMVAAPVAEAGFGSSRPSRSASPSPSYSKPSVSPSAPRQSGSFFTGSRGTQRSDTTARIRQDQATQSARANTPNIPVAPQAAPIPAPSRGVGVMAGSGFNSGSVGSQAYRGGYNQSPTRVPTAPTAQPRQGYSGAAVAGAAVAGAVGGAIIHDALTDNEVTAQQQQIQAQQQQAMNQARMEADRARYEADQARREAEYARQRAEAAARDARAAAQYSQPAPVIVTQQPVQSGQPVAAAQATRQDSSSSGWLWLLILIAIGAGAWLVFGRGNRRSAPIVSSYAPNAGVGSGVANTASPVVGNTKITDATQQLQRSAKDIYRDLNEALYKGATPNMERVRQLVTPQFFEVIQEDAETFVSNPKYAILSMESRVYDVMLEDGELKGSVYYRGVERVLDENGNPCEEEYSVQYNYVYREGRGWLMEGFTAIPL